MKALLSFQATVKYIQKNRQCRRNQHWRWNLMMGHLGLRCIFIPINWWEGEVWLPYSIILCIWKSLTTSKATLQILTIDTSSKNSQSLGTYSTALMGASYLSSASLPDGTVWKTPTVPLLGLICATPPR